MTLGEKQRHLPIMLAELIEYAYKAGYEVTLGDGYRDPRLHGEMGVKKGYGHSKSAHKLRLAIDLNLFKNGLYQTSTEAHKPLGEFWEHLGGSWGGRFKKLDGTPNPDGNHYSIEHDGVK